MENCIICNGNEHHNTGLHKESNLRICKKCGFVSHEIKPEEYNRILDYYRYEYRTPPGYTNLVTTTNKLNYIRFFLADYLKGKHGLVVGDLGAATGYMVNYFNHSGHKCYGAELTQYMRRYSEAYYGFPLTEKLPTDKKYDLLICYHVLEHFARPDEELTNMVNLLKDDGRIMIGVPEYLNILEDAAGPSMTTFESYYHKNHINAFSRQSFANLITKCGLEIEKTDVITYGQTYLLKKSSKPAIIVNETWEEKLKTLEAQKIAIEAFARKDYDAALKAYPRFPEAKIQWLMDKYAKMPEKLLELFDELKTSDSGVYQSFRIMFTHGHTLYQNKRYEEAIAIFGELMRCRPSADVAAFAGWSFYFIGNFPAAIKHFHIAKELNPTKWAEMENWVGNAACKMPTAEERAIESLRRGQNPPVRPEDTPVMTNG